MSRTLKNRQVSSPIRTREGPSLFERRVVDDGRKTAWKIPFLSLQVGSRVGSPFTIINKRFYIYTQVIDFIWSGRPGSNRRRPA
ncbi:MAG: hypothetical protein PHX79_05630, partial [Sphaerochaetaceae bacterium]|nr:hypothetical protein [Sphaerochaetaceae bacterium]